MMGQGILEAGANIGKTLQAGYEGAGAAIAKGITSAASAYADYKKLKTEVAADEKVLGTLTKFMTPEMKTMFDDTSNSDIPYAEKSALYKRAFEYIGGAVTQKHAMDKLQTSGNIQAGLAAEEQKAAAARQAEQLKANEKLQQDRLKAEEDLARFKAVSEAVSGGAFILGPGGVARPTAPVPNFTQERKMNIGGGVYDRR